MNTLWMREEVLEFFWRQQYDLSENLKKEKRKFIYLNREKEEREKKTQSCGMKEAKSRKKCETFSKLSSEWEKICTDQLASYPSTLGFAPAQPAIQSRHGKGS